MVKTDKGYKVILGQQSMVRTSQYMEKSQRFETLLEKEQKRIEELSKILRVTIPVVMGIITLGILDFLFTGGSTILTANWSEVLQMLGFDAIRTAY